MIDQINILDTEFGPGALVQAQAEGEIRSRQENRGEVGTSELPGTAGKFGDPLRIGTASFDNLAALRKTMESMWGARSSVSMPARLEHRRTLAADAGCGRESGRRARRVRGIPGCGCRN